MSDVSQCEHLINRKVLSEQGVWKPPPPPGGQTTSPEKMKNLVRVVTVFSKKNVRKCDF